jgi:hypothetical protein
MTIHPHIRAELGRQRVSDLVAQAERDRLVQAAMGQRHDDMAHQAARVRTRITWRRGVLARLAGTRPNRVIAGF